jgi:hypothetical protein
MFQLKNKLSSLAMLSLCVLIGVGANSFASDDANPRIFSGTWQGKGTYILSGDLTQCGQFDLVFSASANTFSFINGYRKCDKHDEYFNQVKLDVKDGQLLFNGQVVGKYTQNTMELAFRMPDGNSFRNWRMLMRKEGNHLMYEESRTMDGETTPLISFAGLLMLKK